MKNSRLASAQVQSTWMESTAEQSTSNFFLWRLTNRVSSKCVYFLIQSSLRNCHLSYVGHYLSFLVSLPLSSAMFYANHQQKSTGINHSAIEVLCTQPRAKSLFIKSRRGQWSPRELSDFCRCFFRKRRISQCSSNIIGLLKVLAPNNVLWSERFWGCLSKFQTFLLTKNTSIYGNSVTGNSEVKCSSRKWLISSKWNQWYEIFTKSLKQSFSKLVALIVQE